MRLGIDSSATGETVTGGKLRLIITLQLYTGLFRALKEAEIEGR